MSKAALFSRTNIIIMVALLSAVLLLLLTKFDTLRHNLTLRSIDNTWNNVTLTGLTVNNNLQDGLPDNWQARTWGGGSGIIQVVTDSEAATGLRAVTVEKTNSEGVAALTQILPIPKDTVQVSFWIFARGEEGAAQVRFYLEGQTEAEPGGWKTIDASDEWIRYQVEAVVPPRADRVEVLLRSNGLTYFDDAYLWFVLPEGNITNSISNPGFEEDGLDQEPIAWWQEHADIPDFDPNVDMDLSGEWPYLSIMDMLNGRYEAISQRILEQDQPCTNMPEMTSWLLNLAPELEEQGGPAAREKLYQLTIALAPSCPQPYGQLGHLYEDNRAFWAATQQYRKAAELAGETPLAGYYYYNEGLTHVRHTGDLENAIFALEKAEELETWVTGVVFEGASTYNLGLALQDAGRFDEAAAAFQRVLDCDACINYQKAATAALRALNNE